MVLAHTVTPGGPETEYIVVAGALLILGVVFFTQKSVKPIVPVLLILASLAVGAGAFAFRSDASGTGIEMSLISPQAGERVPARKPVQLEVELQGAAMAGEEQDGETPGHLHVYVNGKTVDMPTTLTPEVKLPPGKHEVAVEFVDVSHVSFDPPIRSQVQLRAR